VGNHPTIEDSTTAAIDVLSADPDGFFLMVEAGQIDWAAHSRDGAWTAAEMLAFDEAIEAAYEWAADRTDTLILVSADHECRGQTASTEWMWGQILHGAPIGATLSTYAGISNLTTAERNLIAANRELGIADVLAARFKVKWGWSGTDEGTHRHAGADLRVGRERWRLRRHGVPERAGGTASAVVPAVTSVVRREHAGDQLAGVLRVLVEQASGELLVADLDRIDQRAMLQRDLVERADHPLVETQQAAQRRYVPHEHVVDARVAAELAQSLVEREVGPAGGDGVARRDGSVDLVDELAQPGERPRVLGARDHASGASLERRAEPVDLEHVLGGEVHDERAPARFLLEEPLRAQELERFPHRPPADVELLGDLGLDEVFALFEASAEDLLADPVGGVFRQGSGRLERA
jgi:Alkaline phosphatase